MKITRFEDILVWQKSQELAIKIYQIFRTNKDYSFKDQIQRATVSISNNIAEGYERKSNSELKHFLFIAKGSCGEVRSMLYIAHTLRYIQEDVFREITEETEVIARMLSSFIKKL